MIKVHIVELFPKNPKFFDLFEKLSGMLDQAGTILSSMDIGSKNITPKAKQIRELEVRADKLYHSIISLSESTFVTPIDREDIYMLTKSLDDIIDLVEDASMRMLLFNGSLKSTQNSRQFTNLIHEATETIDTLVTYLKYRDKYRDKMKELIIRAHTLEEAGDLLYRSALSALFKKEKNAIRLIKWKDLYQNLESVMDECEKAADIVEVIIIKNF